MTIEELREKFRQINEYLEAERSLKEELLRLKLHGTRATELEVQEKLAHHDELIAEIERNRRENILPIIEELVKFIAARRKESDTVV